MVAALAQQCSSSSSPNLLLWAAKQTVASCLMFKNTFVCLYPHVFVCTHSQLAGLHSTWCD